MRSSRFLVGSNLDKRGHFGKMPVFVGRYDRIGVYRVITRLCRLMFISSSWCSEFSWGIMLPTIVENVVFLHFTI